MTDQSVAPPALHADRFLPITPVRLVISHKLEDVTAAFVGTEWEQKLQKGLPYKLIENADIARRTIPAMFGKASKLVDAKGAILREAALKKMRLLLGGEVERLQTLARVNDHVRPEEIRLAQAELEELGRVLGQAQLRLDSLRLIWKGPPEALR